MTNDATEEDKKVLCQVLGRLHLPDAADDDKIRTIKLLICNLGTVRLFCMFPPIAVWTNVLHCFLTIDLTFPAPTAARYSLQECHVQV